jgi:hypothetical protein
MRDYIANLNPHWGASTYLTECDINYFRCCHIVYRLKEVSKDTGFTSTYLNAVEEFSKQSKSILAFQYISYNQLLHVTMR